MTELPTLSATKLAKLRETLPAVRTQAAKAPKCRQVSDSPHTYIHLWVKDAIVPTKLRCLPPDAWAELTELVDLKTGLGPIVTDSSYRE